MRIFSIFIMLFLSTGTTISQNVDSTYIQSNLAKVVELQKEFKPRQSLSILNKLLPLAKTRFSSEHILLGKIYFYTAFCKLDLAEYHEAKSYLDQALNIFKLHDSISLELGDTYMLIGIYYDYLSDYDKALAYYDLTKSIYLKLYNRNDFRFGLLYNNMGICIYFKGDIERALSFFNKSLAISVDNKGNQDTKTSRYLSNLSRCHSKLKNLI